MACQRATAEAYFPPIGLAKFFCISQALRRAESGGRGAPDAQFPQAAYVRYRGDGGGTSFSRSTPLTSAPKINVVALMYRNTRVATTPAKLP